MTRRTSFAALFAAITVVASGSVADASPVVLKEQLAGRKTTTQQQ